MGKAIKFPRVRTRQYLRESLYLWVGMGLGVGGYITATHVPHNLVALASVGLVGLGLCLGYLLPGSDRLFFSVFQHRMRQTRPVSKTPPRRMHPRQPALPRSHPPLVRHPRQHWSEAHFRAVTKGLPIPVLLTRASDGKILYANPLSCAGFGLPHEALIGRSILEFYLHPLERQVMLKALRRSGTLYDYTLYFKRADGSCFPGLTSLHSLHLNGEEAVIEWIYDVPARPHLETPSTC